jgi:hypothetical protein
MEKIPLWKRGTEIMYLISDMDEIKSDIESKILAILKSSPTDYFTAGYINRKIENISPVELNAVMASMNSRKLIHVLVIHYEYCATVNQDTSGYSVIG